MQRPIELCQWKDRSKQHKSHKSHKSRKSKHAAKEQERARKNHKHEKPRSRASDSDPESGEIVAAVEESKPCEVEAPAQQDTDNGCVSGQARPEPTVPVVCFPPAGDRRLTPALMAKTGHLTAMQLQTHLVTQLPDHTVIAMG
ncbi:hypothetical protein HaLaN_18976, partial [Haematococcus lacustris]